jgi:hypothetical protein
MKSAWSRLWSWWVYPVGIAVFIALLGILALGIAQDWVTVAIRLLLFGFVTAALYDEKVRRPNKGGRGAYPSTTFLRGVAPFAIVIAILVAVFVVLELR